MDQQTYRTEYLQSDHWKAIRLAVLERDEHRCRICDAKSRLDVHHRTYVRCPWHERIGDLTTLCRPCHELYEDAKRLAKNAERLGPPPLKLRLDAARLPASALDDLKSLLNSFPGESEVVLELLLAAGDRRTLVLAEKVAPTPALRRALEKILGPGVTQKPAKSELLKQPLHMRRDTCLRIVTDNGPLTTHEVASIARLGVGQTGSALAHLRKQGRLEKKGKQWSIKRWPRLAA